MDPNSVTRVSTMPEDSLLGQCQRYGCFILLLLLSVFLLFFAYFQNDGFTQTDFLRNGISGVITKIGGILNGTRWSEVRQYQPKPDQQPHQPDQSKPLVLIWTTFFSGQWDMGLLLEQCPAELNCITTFDRNRVNESAAVVFHIRDMDWNAIPTYRTPDQYYVFVLWESPHHTGLDLSSDDHRHFFNLTMTYRADSDMPSPYGAFRRLPQSQNCSSVADDLQVQIVKEKSKLVAWFVSNCQTPSGRERLVDRLEEHLPVDIYGSCGKLKCTNERGAKITGLREGGRCDRRLTMDYKFYLSLENSLCKDYVTEKLFHAMADSIVVPVVMERRLLVDSIYDKDIAQIINNSIIAVDDFETAEQLAEYLKYLDQNVTAYLEYLQWRSKLELYDSWKAPKCQLCKILKEKQPRKIDIYEWWHGQAGCHKWKEDERGEN